MGLRTVCAVIAGVLAMGVVGVARADDKPDCQGLAYADDLSNLALGAIVGKKVHFVATASDKAGCPSADAPCRRKAFLQAKDNLVIDTDDAAAGYVCAAYIDKHGTETDGWLPAAQVETAPVKPAWRGLWKRDSSAGIDIKLKGSRAQATGEATWGEGAATHEGSIDAEIDPSQPIQRFAIDGDKQVGYEQAGEYDCAVIMRQLGPYLFVVDNNSCGGANVSFTGLYRAVEAATMHRGRRGGSAAK